MNNSIFEKHSLWIVFISICIIGTLGLIAIVGVSPIPPFEVQRIESPVLRIFSGILALLSVVAIILVIYIKFLKKSKDKFFFSFPMSVWKNQNVYNHERNEAVKIIHALRDNLKFKDFYFSGTKNDKIIDFQTHVVAAETDLLEIKNCELFVMVFPEKLSSSVIVEAGYALALGKPSLYFVKNKEDLPYIMRGLGEVRNKSFPAVRIEIFTNYNQLVSIIKNNKEGLIPKK